jgi:hypothetical protein
MQRLWKGLFALLTILSIPMSLATSVTLARAQDGLRAQVEAANSAWTSAFNAKDADGLTALYTMREGEHQCPATLP